MRLFASFLIVVGIICSFSTARRPAESPVTDLPRPAPAAQVAAKPAAAAPAVKTPAPARPAVPELVFLKGVCPPVREPVRMQCDILTDLASRLKDPSYWADPAEPGDKVTHAHEMCHGVSNRLHASTLRHGLYLGDGVGIILPHPRVTITQVAARVPKSRRGKVYDLYMKQQTREWDKAPIYILDEAVAYYAGCVAHRQLGYGKHRSETFDFAKELQVYSEVLVDTVRKLDPKYKEMATLERLVQWQGDRLASLGEPDRTR